MHKYNYYKYEIDNIPGYPNRWIYEIKLDNPYFVDWLESDEWYDTKDEAITACKEHIVELLNGSDERDYDIQPYGQINWEERRKLGE